MDSPRHDRSSSAPGLNRRQFILSVLVGVLTGGALRAGDGPTAPAWVGRLTGTPAASRQLGAAYLLTHPGERDPAYLSDLLEQALVRYVDHMTSSDVDTLTAAAVTMIEREFADAHVVDVDGWVLSVSEARIYALSTLVDGTPE